MTIANSRRAVERLGRIAPVVLAALRDGLTLGEACRRANAPLSTVERWLALGRREPDGPFRAFATAVEQARRPPEVSDGLLSQEELEQLVSRAARAGSVAAMRLAYKLLRERPRKLLAGPLARVVELDCERGRRGR